MLTIIYNNHNTNKLLLCMHMTLSNNTHKVNLLRWNDKEKKSKNHTNNNNIINISVPALCGGRVV